MKSKLIITAAALSSAALVLTACGSDSSKSGASSASTTTSGAAATSASSAPAAATKTIASTLVFGAPAQFKTRPDGVAGLAKKYGVTFKAVQSLDVGGPVTVSALKTGRVDAADLFTTDPAIKANGFVILKDDKNNFGAQNVVPIITKAKATAGVKAALNAVSAKLTTVAIQGLRTSVETNKQDPDAVAKAWLKTNSLDAAGTTAKGVKITVGSAGFPENAVIAEIYAEALKAKGATISTKLNIGERAKYYPALKDGQIDLIPEYSGSIMFYLDKTATAVSSPAVYAALVKALPANLTALTEASGQDSDAIVVTKATAAKYSLTSISDLAKKAS
jgi:glycine betaine/choline ABC-type transport system substrate-binding protein